MATAISKSLEFIKKTNLFTDLGLFHILFVWQLFIFYSLAAVEDDTFLLTDFSDRESESIQWYAVNDGVMGGLSEGQPNINESGYLIFAGKTFLENNGGFSSIRKNVDLDLSAYQGIALRVKGDGRSYDLHLTTNNLSWLMRVSYRKKFDTNGQWQDVFIPFEQLSASVRGRTLEGNVFDPAKVQSIGFMIADKQAGPFELVIDSVAAQ